MCSNENRTEKRELETIQCTSLRDVVKDGGGDS